jgi:16S rRNA (cytosine1402-N4)-methyltransferase
MEQKNTEKNWHHDPVLKKEILESLVSAQTKTFFDGTLGLGGHGEAVLAQFSTLEHYIACDLDVSHIRFAEKRLEKWHDKAFFIHSNFSAIKSIVQEHPAPRPLSILLDLGICSTHVDDAGKGFSFREDGPLTLSFEQNNSTNAEKLLNQSSEAELSVIFKKYGEEPLARKIARKIVEARSKTPLKTTFQLRALVESCTIPPHYKKTLTRIFQAIRIAVNEELEHLQQVLEDSLEIMQSGDRIGIIAYHSLEDRMVKHFFVQHSRPQTKPSHYSLHEVVAPAQFKLFSRKPITPGESELTHNPRARSAKLRIAEKL